MANRVDNGLWALIISSIIIIILYLGFILQTAKSGHETPKHIRVEHLREPLTAALNFVGIQLALLAATATYAAAVSASGTANWFAISAGSTVAAGLTIVWFLFGLPNMAGASETIEYKFPRDWDVLLFPNLIKLLIILGLVSYVCYLFLELHPQSQPA